MAKCVSRILCNIKTIGTTTNIKIPGKKIVCLKDISEGETIGTLKEKIAYQLGVDKQNWGFYAAGPREFLPDNKKVLEINHDKHLHFLPRMVIR